MIIGFAVKNEYDKNPKNPGSFVQYLDSSYSQEQTASSHLEGRQNTEEIASL